MTNEEFAQRQADTLGFSFCVLELINGAVIVGRCNNVDKILAKFDPRPLLQLKPSTEYAGPFRRKHDAEFNK